MKLFKILFVFISIFILLPQNSNSEEVQIIEIILDSYRFMPDEFEVEVNKPVELRLKSVTSIVPHNITIDDPKSNINISKDVKAGKLGTLKFLPTKTGVFEFYCDKKSIFANHRKKGMVGTLKVVEKKSENEEL